MPLLHCLQCHHEWEGGRYSKCDWCGVNGYVIEEKTPMERVFGENIRDAVKIIRRFYESRPS